MINSKFTSEKEEKSTLRRVFWLIYLSINITVIILVILSKYVNNGLRLVYFQVLGTVIRSLLQIMDFEGKRFNKDAKNMLVFMLLFSSSGFQCVILNLIINKKILLYSLSLLASFIGNVGAISFERRLEGTYL